MRVKAKDVQTISRSGIERIIRSHTLKPLVKRISKLLQCRSKSDIYIRELIFRKSIHPKQRYFRDKWELVIFLRKRIINLKNNLLPFIQQLDIEGTETAIEDYMAALIIYTQQKELYHIFYYLRKIELDIKKLLIEIKKLRKQIEIYQSFEVPCEEFKHNIKKLFDKYDYYGEEKNRL